MLLNRRRITALMAAVLMAPIGLAHADAYEDFLRAIRDNDARKAESLLRRGIDPNSVDQEGTPVMMLALREKADAVAQLILTTPGFKPDQPNQHGETALMYAAMRGLTDIAKTLVTLGAEVNREGWSPLHYATTTNQTEMIRWLIEEHAYIDAESPNQTTPLMMAARSKFRESCKLLIELGADPTYKNQAGLTAASYADRADDQELAAWLRRREDDFRKRYNTSGATNQQ